MHIQWHSNDTPVTGIGRVCKTLAPPTEMDAAGSGLLRAFDAEITGTGFPSRDAVKTVFKDTYNSALDCHTIHLLLCIFLFESVGAPPSRGAPTGALCFTHMKLPTAEKCRMHFLRMSSARFAPNGLDS